MARAPIGKHGRDHRAPGTYGADDPGGHDPIPVLATGGIYPAAVQPVPLTSLFYGSMVDFDPSLGWGLAADASSVSGGVFTNSLVGFTGNSRTPALGDYITLPVTLGPKGSAWSLFGNWKLQPDGGIFKVSLASVTDTNGQLQDSSDGELTYIDFLSGTYFDDTYQGMTSYDGGSLVFSYSLVLGGDDGAPFTAVTGTDSDTGYPVIDGGAGVYRWKLEVTGKNASSSGYRVDLMAMAWGRADKSGLI